MNAADLLRGSIETVRILTAGMSSPMPQQIAKAADESRRVLRAYGIPDRDAVRLAAEFAYASAEFADALLTANRKGQELKRAMDELEKDRRLHR
jgi:hypothetical protein